MPVTFFQCHIRLPKRLFRICLSWGITLLYGAAPNSSHAQIRPIAATPETRAVVVGISEYADARIPALQYSDKDAAYFADWLRSPSGGNVPGENVRLLTNADAANGHMVSAFTWLMETSKKDDLAIIYFSGHGDMENQTMMNHGFLLAYDAPASNYMAGGFSIMFLQSIIRTLSTKNQTQVIVIADACRAGALAGEDFLGTQATVKVLADQYANEAKILSCQPHEFSLEGPQWGGGHGVFTWFLVDGLYGLADRNEDLEVSLFELQRYLEDHVPAAVAPKSQIPIITGNKSLVISEVDPDALLERRRRKEAETAKGANGNVRPRGIPAMPADSDSLVLELYRKFGEAIARKNLLKPRGESAYDLFVRIEDHALMAPYRLDMRLNLSSALQNEAQKAINDYLAANPDELRRRWHYAADYDRFPEYLATAAAILGSTHFMYRDLMAKAAYFRGLLLRLAGEQQKDPSLFEQAKVLQVQALAYDTTATYALNELGLLARRNQQWEESIRYFQQVLAYSPTWVLPRSNLCASYLELGDYQHSIDQCTMALARDSTFTLAHYNLGLAYKYSNEASKAIDHLKQAIQYDPAYYRAYFELDDLYWETHNYAAAQSIWEANDYGVLHRLGGQVIATGVMSAAQRRFAAGMEEEALPFLSYLVEHHPDYMPARVLYGGILVLIGEPDRGQLVLEEALALSPDDQDVIFNLGFFYVVTGRYEEALPLFQRLIELRSTHEIAWIGIALCEGHLGFSDQAAYALEKALQAGYKDISFLKNDPLAAPLRELPEFTQLLEKYLPYREP